MRLYYEAKIHVILFFLQAERIEQPHKLFTGSWHKTTKSRYFGLHKESFDGQSSFVLIKVLLILVIINITLLSNIICHPQAAKEAHGRVRIRQGRLPNEAPA